MPPSKITETDCRAWAGRFAAKYDEQFSTTPSAPFDNILERAGVPREENPAFKIKRLGVKQKN